uniref:Uncharacterized protein n=1 Tax=Avena sativa TaxID=4498 RepID=A0ACD6A3P2_AVESA
MVTMQPQAITKVSISALVISLPIIYVSLLRVPPSALARDSTFWFLMSNSIIAIIAADSGMLFLGSADSTHDHDDEDDDLSDAVTTELPVVATVHEDYYGDDAMSTALMPTSHEPTASVDIPSVVVGGGEQLLPTGGATSFKATDTARMEEGHALALIQGEGAAAKPSTDMVVNHASVLQRCEEETSAAPELLEPAAANKTCTMIVEADHSTTSPARPLIAVTPSDDAPQDEGYVVEREDVKPLCSVAEESEPPRQEEEQREYWQLSDEELNRKVEEFITRFNRNMIEQEAAAAI